jgi:type IX secretion system PorP/SprF family membrane protein
MKQLLLSITLLCFLVNSNAQQDPQLTMHKFNQLYVNPAVSGAYEKYEVGLYGRTQWTGFDGSPITLGLNSSFDLESINSGVGIQYYYDALGFEENNKFALSYAYHLTLGTGHLNFGLSAGMINKKLDAVWITPDGTPASVDPSIPDPNANGTAFDLGFGTLYHTDKLQVGFSISHILANEIPNVNIKLARHYWLFVNYDFEIDESWMISPNILIKSDVTSTQLDFNLYVTYNQFIWAGIGYRMADAIMLSIGTNIGDHFRFGYSYDVTISKLNNYSNGSHEVFLGYRIKK